MVSWGYRIHSMQPKFQRSQKRFFRVEDVSEASSQSDALRAVLDTSRSLVGKLQLGTPVYYMDPEHEERRLAEIDAADDVPYFILLKVKRDGRVLRFLIETGKESDHDRLMSRDGSAESMSRRAAVRRFSVWMLFPRAGDYAFMVSEVRGRSYAGELLVQWLTRTLQRDASTVDGDGNREEEPWLNWKLEPRIDGERLSGILSNSDEHVIRLRRHGVGVDGKPGSVDLELVQFGLRQTPLENVLDAILGMHKRFGKGDRADRRQRAANDVVGLLEDEIVDTDFTDGEISFKENGKVQTINSETVDRIFVYPVGSKRPSKGRMLRDATVVVKRLADALGSQIS